MVPGCIKVLSFYLSLSLSLRQANSLNKTISMLRWDVLDDKQNPLLDPWLLLFYSDWNLINWEPPQVINRATNCESFMLTKCSRGLIKFLKYLANCLQYKKQRGQISLIINFYFLKIYPQITFGLLKKCNYSVV